MKKIHHIDAAVIRFFHHVHIPFARIAIFVVFFWFGILKVLGLSPAGPLVQSLFERTIPIMPFATFYVLFALFECAIGILFLIKGAERIVIPLLFLHMVTTFMPLFMLPSVTWSAPFAPTLEGQYIIKNLVIIALAISIAAKLKPLHLMENKNTPTVEY